MINVTIGKKTIGPGLPCLISFEPSATYDSFEEAKDMIKATAMAGADGIKFQTFVTGDADRLMGKKDITVDFSTPTGKKKEVVYEALKRRELPKEKWKELARFTQGLGLVFITTPVFLETIDFLVEIKVDAIKVSKGDINNVILIDQIAKTQIPIILDGREKFQDVERAIKICEKNGNRKIVIMHCPSGYPAENAGIHLRALKTIQEKYEYPVGFADHSPGGIMNFGAIALGAVMIEKTITTDKTKEQVEHFMSLELEELPAFVKNIRSIEEAMGDPNILAISRVEENARRSIVAKTDIKKGQQITLEVLDFRRPGNAGISCSDGFDVVGKEAIIDIPKDTFLQWNMLK
ncbi:MAG: hypothetical protein AUI92_03845 [Thaumarchaeota archaeon 13_1_40CM_3_38_6]|nr:MAG: hypothetical protein AUI92_03845 [Thaumarchaeota archaeon 13_1_40CM_3_38_6]